MSTPSGPKVAVVLFNLGGPDTQEDVRPFLKNLFSDEAILTVPAPLRWFLARLISTTRAKSARANYAMMGGGSPLLPETRKQATALRETLQARGVNAATFTAMRYWKPYAADIVKAVKLYAPDRVVLLPLYPQFSTTTTASSLKSWKEAGGPDGAAICCYPTPDAFVKAHAAKILEAWKAAGSPANVRLLLSAHGLPKKVIDKGDPYQWQVEETVRALMPHLPTEWEHEICYQSRVGPLQWIGPATDTTIEKAAHEGKAILLSPIAFVSEHIETLVELDIEYAHLAKEAGATTYIRAPALGVDPGFIDTLADLVQSALGEPVPSLRSHCGGRICPAKHKDCPHRAPAAA